jgi:shikimate kinase
MPFESQLFDWIDQCLSEPMDKAVIAFSFNLYEPYAIELIGSSEFGAEDSDWACSEDFIPSKRKIKIPKRVCSGDWEECLETMPLLVKKYLASNRIGAKTLQSGKAVAIGFVDGDLEVIHAA